MSVQILSVPRLRARNFRLFVAAFQGEFHSMRQVFCDHDHNAEYAARDGQIRRLCPLSAARG
jgi:hypothetical protein